MMTCPKCQAQMRQYERNGVTIDQCSECRGIFLDRGELERLVDAEAAFNSGRSQPVAPPPPAPSHGGYQQQQQQPRHDDRRYDDRHHDDRQYYGEHGHKRKRKESFFEQLFD
jgi:uncharacterized protein